jgi:hypothetical protein
MQNHLATASIEEGLDFACNLAMKGIPAVIESDSTKALEILQDLAQYISIRYAGELLLALEWLAGIGNRLAQDSFPADQFWTQLRWVADQMSLDASEIRELGIP